MLRLVIMGLARPIVPAFAFVSVDVLRGNNRIDGSGVCIALQSGVAISGVVLIAISVVVTSLIAFGSGDDIEDEANKGTFGLLD